MTLMTDRELRRLSDGCSLLGGGGGGMSAILLAARQAADDHGPVELIDLDDLVDDALVMPCGLLGAPAVAAEKLGDGREGVWLRDRVEEITGRPVAAFMASEVGGANGVAPFVWAAHAGVPVIDADGMGRAFPRIGQVMMNLAGVSPSPCVMTDERANISVFHPTDDAWLDRVCRLAAMASGGLTATAEYLMDAHTARSAVLRGSISRALRIGAAMEDAQPLAAVLSAAEAVVIIDGRISRLTATDNRPGGHGSITIVGVGADDGRLVRLEMQDEILAVLEDGVPLSVVPDIITVLDPHDLRAIAAEDLRAGQRVHVVSLAADHAWLTPEGLELVGPQAFDYPVRHPRGEVTS